MLTESTEKGAFCRKYEILTDWYLSSAENRYLLFNKTLNTVYCTCSLKQHLPSSQFLFTFSVRLFACHSGSWNTVIYMYTSLQKQASNHVCAKHMFITKLYIYSKNIQTNKPINKAKTPLSPSLSPLPPPLHLPLSYLTSPPPPHTHRADNTAHGVVVKIYLKYLQMGQL